jgi:HSP20 family molecular chaperone IbpA
MRNLYGELFGFRREFDELFNRLVTGRPVAEWPELPVFNKEFGFTPAVETYIDKQANKYVCRVTLPGIEPKELTINTQGYMLTIRGERKFQHAVKEVEFAEREITYGQFERMISLPEGVLVEKLNAAYTNGVLEITAPMATAALPRKVEIKTLPEPAAKHVNA